MTTKQGELMWRHIAEWKFDPLDGWYGQNLVTCLCVFQDGAWKKVPYQPWPNDAEKQALFANNQKPTSKASK